jgi:DNA-binding transcriptional MerR regulator
VARIAGVSTDTLRHYERKGLLATFRSPNGYREYPPEAPDRVRLIRRALTVGFSLDELARLLAMRDRGRAPCRATRALAAEKLAAVEAQLRDLAALRDELRVLLEEWDERLAQTPEGQPARLLEQLASRGGKAAAAAPALSQRWRTRGSGRGDGG